MMPNHIHGIIALDNASISLSSVIQKFKSMTTCKYIEGVRNHHWKTFDKKLWQRNYYEHIIRNDKSLDTIQNYIINNPKNWDKDQLYRAT
jgi:REP element-mobilizing transposase RayT